MGEMEPLWFEGEALPQPLPGIADRMTDSELDGEKSESDDEESAEPSSVSYTLYNSDSDSDID